MVTGGSLQGQSETLMPTYEVQAPDGRTFEIEGNQPPSEQELSAIFSQMGASSAPQQPNQEGTYIPGVGVIPPVSKMAEYLPAAGMALGGTIGGMGGAAFGVGFGGVPGAAGGAALGGAAGEAARQMLTDQPPATSGEAAQAIAGEALTDAAIVGAPPLAGKAVRAAAVPLARGAIAAGKGIYQGQPALTAAVRGVEAAAKPSLKALEARIMHALGRAAKETGKKAISIPKSQAAGTVEEMQGRILGWVDQGFSQAQMADALRRIYPSDLTSSASKKVVGMVLDAHKIARK